MVNLKNVYFCLIPRNWASSMSHSFTKSSKQPGPDNAQPCKVPNIARLFSVGLCFLLLDLVILDWGILVSWVQYTLNIILTNWPLNQSFSNSLWLIMFMGVSLNYDLCTLYTYGTRTFQNFQVFELQVLNSS